MPWGFGISEAARSQIIGRVLAGTVSILVMVSPAAAASFTVSNANDSGAGSLRQAIADSNTAGGTNVITFTVGGTITLTSELPVITSAVTINGNGNNPTISGNNTYRVFFVDAPSGSAVNISNLTIANGSARGGNGSDAGGGGLGAGGAIFGMSGAITLTNVGLSGNAAQGGNGGGSGVFGGGGGLGGNGGTPSGSCQSAGGGGIGAGATGGNSTRRPAAAGGAVGGGAAAAAAAGTRRAMAASAVAAVAAFRGPNTAALAGLAAAAAVPLPLVAAAVVAVAALPPARALPPVRPAAAAALDSGARSSFVPRRSTPIAVRR
jgi:fibronectin-binding autotransporter adhesin